jgi:hypothetical protein
MNPQTDIGPEIHLLLGRVVITSAAMDAITPTDVARALEMQIRSDWRSPLRPTIGVDHVQRQAVRRLDPCKAKNGTRFWVITEAGRAETTVLLPAEY